LSSPPHPVTIVLVHHDQPERCAASVAAFRLQEGVADVWVVESSSRASSRARLRDLAPDVRAIDAGGNVGFGPGANLGLRHWLDDRPEEAWVGVAPHDAGPEPGCVARILAAVADRPTVGLVSAEFGPEFDLVPVYDHVLGGYYRTAERGEGWQEADYPHGTLLLARRQVLEQVGLFDERYFAYCEEVDLGLRARRAGWQVGFVWGAEVTNGRLPARPVADYLQLRNTLLLVSSHEGPKEVRARVILAFAHHVADLGRARRGAWARARLALKATWDYRRRRFGPPPTTILG
jgi:N-acetylglucosaminyl-diphospho-decaprenol L-rhamnosyltransferase